ncbi:hypothetical protein ABFX02_10G123400 [Erythranthe guttata]
MEDDDEFGDLYTDVLRPLTTQFQPHQEEAGSSAPGGRAAAASSSQGRRIDLNINSDDEEILYGAPDLKKSDSNSNLNPSSSALRWNLNAPIQEKALPEPRGFDLNLNSDSDAAKIDGLAENRADDLAFDEARVSKKGEGVKSPPQKASGGSIFLENDDDDDINIIVEEGENKDDDFLEKDDDADISGTGNEPAIGVYSEQMIPGLSGRLDNPRDSNFVDDWESEESEDDLQIVLNDNNHGPVGMAGVNDEDDEDGEQLVILADNGDVGHHHHQQPHQMMMEEPEWGGEEGGPAADGDKDLGDAAKASGGGGGGAAPTAVQPKVAYSNHGFHHPFHSQFKYVRPGAAPLPPGGIAGPVRPPVNMAPMAGRGRGDWRPPGMKGALPMQKGFHPGYGGMQAGRGFGSGLDFTLPSHKTIFEVDIDSFEEKPWKLPTIDVSDFFNFGLDEDSWKDYCKQLEQLRLETTMQSKIRVYESGRAERDYDPDLPPELAAAVGIQDIPPENANRGNTDAALTDIARANANGRSPLPVGRPIPVESGGGGDRVPSVDSNKRIRMHDADVVIEIICHSSVDDDEVAEQQDDEPPRKDGDDVAENVDSFSPAYNGQKRESGSRRAQLKKNTVSTDRETDILHEDERRDDKTSPTSSPSATESDREKPPPVEDEMNDGPLSDDRSFDMEREKIDVDTKTEDGNLLYPTKKQKLGSLAEQLSQEDDDDDMEDSKAGRSSDTTSKARSGSSKDFRKFPEDADDEVLQDRRPPRAGFVKREVGNVDSSRRKGYYERDETERHVAAKGRDYSFPHRHVAKNESTEWKKEYRDADNRRGRTRDMSKGRESESRSEKDENHQSRNQMDNGGNWRGASHDHNLKNRNENADAFHSKRRKEEVRVSQERAEKEDISDNHRENNSSRRKRERDDGSDQIKRDVHNNSNARQKEGGSSFQRERIDRQRERDEWYRIKQEEIPPREREETRLQKPRMSHSRGKDDYNTGSSREYHSKDVYARGSQHINDEKRARYDRPNNRDGRVNYGSDTSRVHEEKRKESSRKSKELDGGDRSSLNPYKRNQNEHGGQISKKVNMRGRTEPQRGEVDVNHHSSKKHREEVSSDDEQLDSKKGRSKLERWTSHKERDFGGPTMPPSLPNKPPEESSRKIQDAKPPQPPLVEENDTVPETNNNNVNPKAATEDNNKHLDTVEKLKKRSERFKLPMKNEKDVSTTTVKNIESEKQPTLPLVQTETRPTDSEIKSERPARKRRWTGN